MTKVKILPNVTKFYWGDFEKSSSVFHCFFRCHVCLSKLKHAPSRELPRTARKTVLSHLKWNPNDVLTTCKAIIKGFASRFVHWSWALRKNQRSTVFEKEQKHGGRKRDCFSLLFFGSWQTCCFYVAFQT